MKFLKPEELLSVLRIAKQRWNQPRQDLTALADIRADHEERTQSLRDHLLILLAYKHGLRAAEVTGLRITDVVDKSLDIKRLKGSKRTIQPMEKFKGEPLLNEDRGLSEWMRIRPSGSGDALFPSAKGGFLNAKSFNAIFHKYARQVGINLGPHSLKHSLATHLVRANVNLAVVQSRLGHASLSSTQQYIHLNDQEVAEKTNNALYDVFR